MTDSDGLDALFGYPDPRRRRRPKPGEDPNYDACRVLRLKTRLAEMEGR